MSLNLRVNIIRLAIKLLQRIGMLEAPESLHFLSFNDGLGADRDNDGNNHYTQCLLFCVDHYKCLQNPEHEFLVLQFSHWKTGSSATAALCVDCTVDIPTHSHASGLLTPSSSEYPARDTVYLIGRATSLNIDSHLTARFKSYRRISSLSFNLDRPSVLQVTDLLLLVNQQDLNYDILRTQCYWWSGTVCKSLERLFRGEEEVFDLDNRGHFGPITLIQPSEDDISNICAKFWPAHKVTEKQVAGLQLQHQAERAQILEQGRSQRQPEIDERDRQIEERNRQVEERNRQIAELVAELERMRTQRTPAIN
ncbi:hypothetical protein BDR07DRAFT_1521825 [Suillus spraguei]|nr:hypothetical protein BDR07DRAFT_1521825 [Suillus spraguei]